MNKFISKSHKYLTSVQSLLNSEEQNILRNLIYLKSIEVKILILDQTNKKKKCKYNENKRIKRNNQLASRKSFV